MQAVAGFFANPVVSAGMKKNRLPSYVAGKAFSAVVIAAPAFADFDKVPGTAKEAIANLPSAYLRRVATSLCDGTTRSAADLRGKLEAWYDSSMERVSGWYKRRAQLMLLAIGLALAFGLNVDTIQITHVLWSDSTVRAAVAAEAENVAQSGAPKDVTAEIKSIKDMKSAAGLEFPGFPQSWSDRLLKLLGCLITALAVVLGAPFWFDLLSRFTKVRFSGSPPEPAEKSS